MGESFKILLRLVSMLQPDISNMASSAVVISGVTVAIQILSNAICSLSDEDRKAWTLAILSQLRAARQVISKKEHCIVTAS